MAKFKVGDKVRCVEAEDCDYEIVEGEVYTVTDTHEKGVEIGGEFKRLGCFFKPNRFELVEEACVIAKQTTFDLRNTKINVKAYAEKHGLTLDGANKEIQAWLLENTEGWRSGTAEVDIGVKCLFVDQSLLMQCDYNLDLFNTYSEKEVTISRQVVLTPSYVEEELVEFDGKKYNKQETLAAIAKLEGK